MAATNSAIYSTSTINNAFKILYTPAELERMFRMSSPLLAEVTKTPDFGGLQQDMTIAYDHSAVGTTIADAFAGRSHSKFQRFSITRGAGYAAGRVENEAIAAATNKGAFISVLRDAMDSCMDGLNKWVATQLYRDGTGAMATVSSVTLNTPAAGTDRILLSNKADVLNFSEGQYIIFRDSVADGNAIHGAAGGTGSVDQYQISKLDLDGGYVYVLGDTETTVAVANGDLMYFGTSDANVTAGRYLKGLAAWIPAAAPSSGESFFGIDRSVNPTRLAGHRISDTSLSLKQTIQKLGMMIRLGGGSPNRCYMNPAQGYQLSNELNTNVVQDPGGVGLDGWSGFKFVTTAGNIAVMLDPACPEDKLYVGNIKGCKISHARGLPHVVDEDGNTARQSAFTDGDYVDFALRFWAQFIVPRPYEWGCATISPVL